MNANEILLTSVKMVDTKTRIEFFNQFSKHYNLNEKDEKKAFEDFEILSKMDISLSLALNTAIAFARM